MSTAYNAAFLYCDERPAVGFQFGRQPAASCTDNRRPTKHPTGKPSAEASFPDDDPHLELNQSMTTSTNKNRQFDPTFLHARREAVVIVLLFLTFCCWSIATSYFLGYSTNRPGDTNAIVAGMPAWVFWGIFIPWIGVDVAALWFCFVYMADDDLGEEEEETPEGQNRV